MLKLQTNISLKFILAVSIAIVLNISGFVIGKYLALNWHNLFLVIIFFTFFFIIYTLRFVFWIKVAKLYQLSYIYPFMSLSYLLSLFLGYYLFNEEVSINKIIGSLLIVLGLVFINKSNFK